MRQRRHRKAIVEKVGRTDKAAKGVADKVGKAQKEFKAGADKVSKAVKYADESGTSGNRIKAKGAKKAIKKETKDKLEKGGRQRCSDQDKLLVNQSHRLVLPPANLA